MPECMKNTRVIFHGELESNIMLKRIYRISEGGSWNILKSGLYMCLFNLATLLPVLLLAMVANEMMKRYFGLTHD